MRICKSMRHTHPYEMRVIDAHRNVEHSQQELVWYRKNSLALT